MPISIEVSPELDLIDTPRRVVVSGLSAGIADFTAYLEKPDGSRWASEATFRVLDSGDLNLNTMRPESGDWQAPYDMAFVSAMRQLSPPIDDKKRHSIEPLCIQLRIEDANGDTASASFIQEFVRSTVSKQEIDDPELSGTVFRPSSAGHGPIVMVLDGSGGGTPLPRAALYASRGFTSVALAYFNAPKRPEHISDTPLEYFKIALAWIDYHLKSDSNPVVIEGLSRGGELALLLASRFPDDISGVVSFVPSAYVNGTLRAGRPEQPRDADCWTWEGVGLINLWRGNPSANWAAFDEAPDGESIRQAPAFFTALENSEFAEKARIPVENIQGPILLVSAGDDGYWPSEYFCDSIARKLSENRFSWPVRHIKNPGAGHFVGFPYVPTTNIASVHPVAGVSITAGGSQRANSIANQHTWGDVIEFLSQIDKHE